MEVAELIGCIGNPVKPNQSQKKLRQPSGNQSLFITSFFLRHEQEEWGVAKQQ